MPHPPQQSDNLQLIDILLHVALLIKDDGSRRQTLFDGSHICRQIGTFQPVVVLQEKSVGANGLNLPSIIEETRVLNKYLSITRAFHEKRCTRKSRL